MKKQNKILDFADIFNTYISKIPAKQLKLLKERKWLPILENSNFARECAYLVGKVMGDGHLEKNFAVYFIGQKSEMKKLKEIILKSFRFFRNIFSYP